MSAEGRLHVLRKPDPTKLATVGDRLTYARAAAQLTRDWVRKKTGIPVLTLQSYEYGKRAVPMDRIRPLAALYRCSVKWLTLGEGEAPAYVPPRKLTELERIMRCL